jgi:hypothetical protein
MDPAHDTFGVAKLSLPLTCCYKEILALVKKTRPCTSPSNQSHHPSALLCCEGIDEEKLGHRISLYS